MSANPVASSSTSTSELSLAERAKHGKKGALSPKSKAAMELEWEKYKDVTITKHMRDEIAVRLGLSDVTVSNWFQTRKRKIKAAEARTAAATAPPPPPAAQTPQEKADRECTIMYKWAIPKLSDLQALYVNGRDSITSETAELWAEGLELNPQDVAKWLKWRRSARIETMYAGREPTPAPVATTPSPASYAQPPLPGSASSSSLQLSGMQLPTPTSLSGSGAQQQQAQDRGSHLPTPFSASPSPRNGSFALKNEPPPSPILHAGGPSRSNSLVTPGFVPWDPQAPQYRRASGPAPTMASPSMSSTSVSHPHIVPSNAATASALRRASAPIPTPLAPPAPPATTVPSSASVPATPNPAASLSLAEYIRSQYATRDDFRRTAGAGSAFVMPMDWDDAIGKMNELGRSANALLERLGSAEARFEGVS